MLATSESSLCIHTPATVLIAGPSMSGKSTFIRDLIKHKDAIFHPVPERIIYSYKCYQPIFQEMDNVEFIEGIDNLPIHTPQTKPTLLVVDDQMSEMTKDILHLFTRGCHHNNISLIFIVQNLFCQNKHFRTASLNTHYMVIFKNPRDICQVSNLARQIFPKEKAANMVAAYEDATRAPYGYLFIDLKSHTPDMLRLRSCILPNHGEEMLPGYKPTVCYRI